MYEFSKTLKFICKMSKTLKLIYLVKHSNWVTNWINIKIYLKFSKNFLNNYNTNRTLKLIYNLSTLEFANRIKHQNRNRTQKSKSASKATSKSASLCISTSKANNIKTYQKIWRMSFTFASYPRQVPSAFWKCFQLLL